MKALNSIHNFHIPVMGLGFTIDAPVKVAHLGISSVISIVDDVLVEKMREFYCKKIERPYHAITDRVEDFRAKRITAYIDLIDEIVTERFHELKQTIIEKGKDFENFFNLLPDYSEIKNEFQKLINDKDYFSKIGDWIHHHLRPGSIDVNIMTKLDKDNYSKGEKLPVEFNDAHAALRGFANSKLKSSIILSAGMNPRLYAYIEQFNDFYPDEEGNLAKKVILKVSDYRSAIIQGKFLAKKGIWVSEYRVESGLNCGGHAFASDGSLMGPILEEFKQNRQMLIDSTFEIYATALKQKNRICPDKAPEIKITAQGGVGTAEEHQFLLNYYELDSVGWGSPFLLVPEVTNVDPTTLEILCNATEKDFYLSNVSPLGVPFNSVRGNTKDVEKLELASQNNPGSGCPKRYLVSNTEYTEKPICTASKKYQKIKINELNEMQLSKEDYHSAYSKIIDKVCLCVGLAASAKQVNKTDDLPEDKAVAICPGPNLAYFSHTVSLREMVDHIYGRINIIKAAYRPNMFVKELKMYIDYFRKKISEKQEIAVEKHYQAMHTFREKLNSGIDYYKSLFAKKMDTPDLQVIKDFEKLEQELNSIEIKSTEPIVNMA
ncbi:MAG: hypothetical protein U0W24_22360 [Bacteroidales bacterium]